MRRRWMVMAWGTFLAVGGTVGGTIGYGLYYRSDRYRLGVERRLTAFFGLPTDVGAIRPWSFRARELRDIRMWLPDRRAQIFHSPRVIWDRTGAGDNGGTLLHIHDAVMSIGSEEWQKADYLHVLRASLLHNFLALNIRRVQFHNARLTWPRKDFALSATGVDGNINFDDQGRGIAELTSRTLNGTSVSDPIRIWARVDPHQQDDFIPEVTLEVPTLPLGALGLDRLLQSPITQGSFAGRIKLYQLPGDDRLELRGLAHDVRLEELTQRLAGGPLPALVDLTIDEAVLRGRTLDHVYFSGQVRSLGVEALLSRLGLPAIGGQARLTIYNGRVVGEVVEQLGVSGRWMDGSLAALTEALLGQQGVQGRLTVVLNVLIIENNQVVSGNIDLIAEPPPGQRGTIDRALLLDLVQKRLGLTLPDKLLPETIEFVQLGCKLLIDQHYLRILSLQGPAGPALLTVRLFGQDLPLLGQVDLTMPIEPILGELGAQARRLKEAWKQRLKPSAQAPRGSRGASPNDSAVGAVEK